MSDLAAFQGQIGYAFRDVELLRLALTHSSVTQEKGPKILHNQRLEFLGDAVLQLALTRELYDRHPTLDEGTLTKTRAQLVNSRSLTTQAGQLNLGQHIILSRSEAANGGRARPSILADAFEALLGALFLDGGYEVARAFVLQRFAETLATMTVSTTSDNPKSDLQEMLQAESSVAPVYQLESSSGPDHDRSFECSVHHQGVELGRGGGKSKKLAESAAAEAALTAIRQKAGSNA